MGGTSADVKERQVARERLSFNQIYKNLSGTVALQTATVTPLRRNRGEKDTEYVKRIVATYAMLSQS